MEPNELAAVAGRYRDMIYRVALHWCGHPQEAEDATQDTLLKLCATHRTFADEEHLKSWLIRVTINHCKSRLRAPWHTRRLPLEELPDTPVFDDPAQRELYDAVLALPQAYRIVLYLFYYEDMPTREIATALHISQNAVTTRLTRARAQLRGGGGPVCPAAAVWVGDLFRRAAAAGRRCTGAGGVHQFAQHAPPQLCPRCRGRSARLPGPGHPAPGPPCLCGAGR